MSFELALRLIEVGLSLALLQRAAEHVGLGEWRLFGPQALLAGGLALGVAPLFATVGLWALGLVQLHRFQGPFNGGADKMAFLILTCLAVARVWPDWADVAVGYLAVQLVLSYVVSGWVKLRSSEWRSGRALAEVFAVSAYPVAEDLRALSQRTNVMRAGSWAVIGFEVAFPLALLHPTALGVALGLAALFHLANACLFGLNRFLWIWLAAYPSVIWFQAVLV